MTTPSISSVKEKMANLYDAYRCLEQMSTESCYAWNEGAGPLLCVLNYQFELALNSLIEVDENDSWDEFTESLREALEHFKARETHPC